MPTGLGNFPSINELLESPPLKSLVERVNPARVMNSVRSFVDGMRQEVQTAVTQRQIPSAMALAEQIAQWIMGQEQAGVRGALNATGILLHPELGGAPLPEEAIAAMRAAAGSYSLSASGLVAGKTSHVDQLLQKLIGCEAALVTSNQAMALALVTNVLACGRAVIVPRSQMATAADGTRAFEVIAAAGGIIHEVGSANELTLNDLSAAASSQPGFLFWQQLAYEMTGHHQPLELVQVATWASRRALPLIVELGLGGLHDCASFGLEQQLTATAALQAGATAVIFRGDGLLGGPACGVIAGKSAILSPIASSPLFRAAASDKLTLAALEATLELYQAASSQSPTTIERSIPLLSLLATSPDNLKHRCERLAPQLAALPALAAVEARAGDAHLTAAKLASQRLPSWGLALQSAQGSAAELLVALSNTTPAIIARVEGNTVWLDLRAISPREDQQLVLAVEQLGKAGETVAP